MKLTFKRAIMPSVMASGLVGATLLPMQPASADQNVWRDIGIGAAAGAASSAITGHKFGRSVLNGAAAGAAVNQSRDLTTPKGKRPGVVQDAAVGAAASTVTGRVTAGGKHTRRDAINGAATGALINILTPRPRR